MLTITEKLTQDTCNHVNKEKICRSRGGESCAFDGAMIVLQPIADSAHIVHGPIACCGNSWEGRGALSSKGSLYRMGFTTDMNEMDIIYGSEERLYNAIVHTYQTVKPKAIFVYATCVSGLIGEDIESVCKKAEASLGIRIIPVNAPGFVGPKNLGNRIAGQVLIDHVIGTGKPPYLTEYDINLIGEYNIAGDLWLVEPILNEAGIRILSRITGDSTYEEITYAHRAKLNVVVCSRALINVAKEMERKYKIPYIEVSFFGKTEMSKALRVIALSLKAERSRSLIDRVESIIAEKEAHVNKKLENYRHLRGKRAVLYTGGVKSWSFISALMDLGIEIVAIGTKKSTFEDEQKMKEILGQDAPLIEDVTATNLLRLMKERYADILIAGGRNQYLAIKEGFPFVDVNQERHIAYAGYDGLINLAEQISNSIRFYNRKSEVRSQKSEVKKSAIKDQQSKIVINPLKHSQSIGAVIAFQGVDRALPVIHGAQGCSFLAKVLLTKHFRELIALASAKLFTEDVVMGSEDRLIKTVTELIKKNNPEIVGIITSGLTEVKGDDVVGVVRDLSSNAYGSDCQIVYISTPDYEDDLEKGYAKTIKALVDLAVYSHRFNAGQINVLAGSHLTPADFVELRDIMESFGLKPIILPDLSALDGSRQGFSALAVGGTKIDEIKNMGRSEFTIAIGASMEPIAELLKGRFRIEYKVFESLSGLKDTDMFIETLSILSGKQVPAKYERQRRVLIDRMREAHPYYGSKKLCIALENDHSIQMSRWLHEMGAEVEVVDTKSEDLFSLHGDFDLLIANSHAEDTAKKLAVPLYQMGFPVYKILGNTNKVTIGYRGTLSLINDVANLLMEK